MTRLSFNEQIRINDFLTRLKWELGIELKQVVFIPSRDNNFKFDKIGILSTVKSASILKAKKEGVSFIIGFDLIDRFNNSSVLFVEKNVLFSLYNSNLPLFSWEIWGGETMSIFFNWLIGGSSKIHSYHENEKIRGYLVEDYIVTDELLKKMTMLNLISSINPFVRNLDRFSQVLILDEEIDIRDIILIRNTKIQPLLIMTGEREKARIYAEKMKTPLIQISKRKLHFVLTKLMSRKLSHLFPGVIVKEIVV